MNEVATTTQEKPMEYVPFGSQDKIKLTIKIIQSLVAVKTKSGKTCDESSAIRFMMMCQARRLNPFEGDAYLIGYDGKDGPTFSLITAHQAFLKRAELNPEYDGMKSGIIVKEGEELKDIEGDFYTDNQHVVGGWATVFFKNRKEPMKKRIRLQRFQKPFGVWQDDPAGMICKCAEADALRSSFPTMLGGLYLREEVEAREISKVSAPIFEAKVIPVSTEEVSQQVPLEAKPGAPLKALRLALKGAGIAEGLLLDYLASTGSTDGDFSTLDEVALSKPELIATLVENWETVTSAMKEVNR